MITGAVLTQKGESYEEEVKVNGGRYLGLRYARNTLHCLRNQYACFCSLYPNLGTVLGAGVHSQEVSQRRTGRRKFLSLSFLTGAEARATQQNKGRQLED